MHIRITPAELKELGCFARLLNRVKQKGGKALSTFLTAPPEQELKLSLETAQSIGLLALYFNERHRQAIANRATRDWRFAQFVSARGDKDIINLDYNGLTVCTCTEFSEQGFGVGSNCKVGEKVGNHYADSVIDKHGHPHESF